jgi:hypothetical protein
MSSNLLRGEGMGQEEKTPAVLYGGREVVET